MIDRYLLAPPYTVFDKQEPDSTHPGIGPGTMYVLRPAYGTSVDHMLNALEDGQRTHLRATFLLWLDQTGTAGLPAFISSAAKRGVRAFVLGSIPDRESLRSAVTCSRDLGDDLSLWLRRRGHPVDSSVARLVAATLEHGRRDACIRSLAEHCNASAAHWKTELRRCGLPDAKPFQQIVLLLGVALHVQREPHGTLAAIAERFGYYDDAAIRRRLFSVFGCNPTLIRNALGWEWLADTALRRACVGRPASNIAHPRHSIAG